jgi:protein gp37
MSAGGNQFTWLDWFWNLFIGCRCVSAGCKFCPALAELARKGHPKNVVIPALPREWRKIDEFESESLVMLCSDSDFFIEEARLLDWWAKIVPLLRRRPDVVFLALTKRLWIAREFVAKYGPLPNLLLGTSAEDQQSYDERVAELYTIPAVGYVISLQPLLGEIDPGELILNKKLQLVVTGCEMGKKARRCPQVWLDKIEAPCREHSINYFCVRWMDADGTVQVNHTLNDRGGNNKIYPGFNPNYRYAKTVAKMLGLDLLLRHPEEAVS